MLLVEDNHVIETLAANAADDPFDESQSLQAVAVMQQGTVVDLNSTLALGSARISVDLGLPMADSIMLAAARAFGATLWTQDADFEGIEGVRYRPKKP